MEEICALVLRNFRDMFGGYVQEADRGETVDPKIINLSNRTFSNHEIKLLSRGLKFTPTPTANKPDIVKDTEEFCRKLRLREFFGSDQYEDESLVRNRKGFKPAPNRDKDLDSYINRLKKVAESNKITTTPKSNISNIEQKALKELQTEDSIIIKEADKGGAIIIMDTDHYKEMALEQLGDRQFYIQVTERVDKLTSSKVNKFTTKFNHHLTKNEADYLTNYEIKSSNFYGLPKIHKSKDIQHNIKDKNAEYVMLPRPTDLKLRPIIAGPASSTQRLSNLLDIILKPLCKMVPSFIRDDLDFLNYIPTRVSKETILVSFDVTSLYTNIPHNLGIEAIEYWITKHPEQYLQRFPKEFIVEGLRIVLENNTFFFDGHYYLQIKGTAMGTKVAPTYATLVMGYLETKLYTILGVMSKPIWRRIQHLHKRKLETLLRRLLHFLDEKYG